MRQRFFRDLDVLQAGGEPKAIIRDPEVNRCLRLPIIGRTLFVEGDAVPRPEFAFGRPAGGGAARL